MAPVSPEEGQQLAREEDEVENQREEEMEDEDNEDEEKQEEEEEEREFEDSEEEEEETVEENEEATSEGIFTPYSAARKKGKRKSLSLPSTPRMTYCGFCDLSLYNEAALKRHWRQNHQECDYNLMLSTETCDMCESKQPDPRTLATHMSRTHKDYWIFDAFGRHKDNPDFEAPSFEGKALNFCVILKKS